MNIIARNLLTMLRSGALNEYSLPEKMSAYKWLTLVDAVERLGVTNAVARAVKNMQFESEFDMPEKVREHLFELSAKAVANTVNVEFNNDRLNRKMQEIHSEERHAIDTSIESLDLLNTLVANITSIINSSISFRLLLRLGNQLRLKGDKVDFVKIETWLKRLHMEKMAQLVGSLLIYGLSFEKDELPFVKKTDPKAAQILEYAIAWALSGAKHASPIASTISIKAPNLLGYSNIENGTILIRSLKQKMDEFEE